MSDTLSVKLLTKSSTQERQVSTCQAIRHQHRHLKLVPTGDDRSVGISYLSMPYFDADDVVTIDDKSSLIDRNLPRVEEAFALVKNTWSFKTPYKNNLVTHVFYSPDDNQTDIPLFYRHQLKVDSAENHLVNLDSIVILDKNFKPIASEQWSYNIEWKNLYETTHGTYGQDSSQDQVDYINLFNNFESWYSERSGDYECFFVQYSLVSGAQKIELLDNQPIFYRKTLDTFDYKYVYSLELAGDYYNVDMLYRADKYAVKAARSARIYCKNTLVKELGQHWSPRINNGCFITSRPDIHRYEVKEFTNQAFYPVYPYKQANRTQAQILKPNLLWIPIQPLALSDSLPIDIIIKDRKHQIKQALTTGDKTSYIERDLSTNTPRVAPYVNISSQLTLDRLGGFIYLGAYKCSLDDVVLINCFYEETSYSIEEIELNPALDNEVLDLFYVVLIEPDTLSTNYHSIHWFSMNRETQTIQATSENLPTDLSSILIPGDYLDYSDFLYNYTAAGIYYFVPNEEIILSETSDPEIFYFMFNVTPIEEGVVFSNGLIFTEQINEEDYGSDINWSVLDYGSYYITGDTCYVKINTEYYSDIDPGYVSYSFTPNNDKQYLLIGEIASNEVVSPQQLSSIDIRALGGGIKETKEEVALTQQDEVQWYWDLGVWDGKAIPAMGSILVEYPWYYEEV